MDNQYVQFQVDGEKYAIHISEISEIVKMQNIRRIPNVPPHVKGIVNLRTNLIPVVSLRTLFNLSNDQYGKQTRIIIVNGESGIVGLIVDSVDRVVTFSDIKPPVDNTGRGENIKLVGIGICGDDIVGILNLDTLLLQ